jgi:hypothetical protein
MSVDNRTVINDCEATTGWSGDDTVSTDTAAGAFYEGSTALTWQAGINSEQMSTTQDSVGAGTFSLDWSDSCIYILVKDNLGEGFSTGGVQLVLGDGTDLTGYNVGGNDAPGISLPTYFQSYKLDVSVVVTTPGSFTDHAGTEANLDQTAITVVGIGVNHLADAMGPSDNSGVDCIRYIANDSYALTVNGGTVGTPETMTDVAGDDVTNGWGMVSNPIGSQFLFFAPTEWGEDAAAANHFFAAENEQWYWLGDNGGGHAVGAGHFIFRVIGNATDTGLFQLTNVVIVNTGTGADFDCSSANVDTLEIDGCSLSGLSTFDAPASGGTSRFCTNTIFSACGTVTHGGADMGGCQFLEPTVAADTGALVYNIALDPDGETDDMVFVSHATTAHHAIEFGTSAGVAGAGTRTMTVRGHTYTGFNAADGNNDSTYLFPDTGGDIDWTLNVVGATGNTSFKKVRSGDTVTIVVDPVTTIITVKDKDDANVENAQVLVEAQDGTDDLPFDDTVTITRAVDVASVTHTTHGMIDGDKVTIRGANEFEFNGVFSITNTTTNAYDYTLELPIEYPIMQTFTAATAHLVTMPTTVAEGDGLIVIFCVDAVGQSPSTPTGWTLEHQSVTVGVNIFKKVADGTEGGTTVDFVTPGSVVAISHAFRVQDWGGALADIEADSFYNSGSSVPDPPDFNPGWGIDQTAWIAVGWATNGTPGTETAQSGYTKAGRNNQASSGLDLQTTWRENSVVSENPGDFSASWSANPGLSVGATIAIRKGHVPSTATGTIKATGVVLHGLTNASGQVSASRTFTVDQAVRLRVRKTAYKAIPPGAGWVNDVVDNVNGLSKTVQLLDD